MTYAAKNPYQQAKQQYEQQSIETASREEILVMLFDGAIKFCNRAKGGIGNKDREAAHHNLIRAQAILMELMTSLDMNMAGDVAKNLFSLYEYLHYNLVQANIHQKIDLVDEVLAHLRELRSTWDQAIQIAAKEKAELKQQAASSPNPQLQMGLHENASISA